MAYLGKSLVGILNESKTIDTMTGNGSTTTLTLSKTPGSVNNVEVYMDGVFQTPSVEYTLSGNTVSFSTAPENGMVVVALSGNDSEIITPNDNSISGSKIAGAVVTDAKIAGMAANKLNGALPAVDGSALTNMPSAVTKSASDPATDSNPAGGVGTIWANTTSGEMYVLIDATTDANIWFNVGGGDGDVVPYSFQGTISGYTSGGRTPNKDVIDKFSFTSDGDATDHGDLSSTRGYAAGQSSSTHGYISGNYPNGDQIDKFAFTSNTTGTDVGNLTVGRDAGAGQSTGTHGYTSGGNIPTSTNVIDKFSFSTDGNATDVGDLLDTNAFSTGQSSGTHGYNSGGWRTQNPSVSAVVQKWTFAADANSTNVGNLTLARGYTAGESSTTHGYVAGGYNPSLTVTIDKFTFASDNDATDVADITSTRAYSAGQSSTTQGYLTGGNGPTNIIEKFPFASDANGTNIGNLTVSRYGPAGQQY